MTNEQIIAKIESSVSKMPSLPTTVAKILQICNDPRTSPSDLNQVIGLDPVLMGKVLRLINSAYYSLPNQITSLVRAIIMLGINTVKNLALSTAVLGNLSKGTSTVLNLDGFWRHSICVGVTAKNIAGRRKVDPKAQEEYFVAGLLHDIGKIPLNGYVPEEYLLALSTTDREHTPLYVAETHTLGINHSQAGKLVAEAWKLDECVTTTITHHHCVADYDGEHEDVLFTVAAANAFANTFEIGFSGDRHPEPVPEVVFERLGLDWDVLEEIEDIISGEIEKAQIFLQVAK